jgi:hypothetical protein
MATGSSWIDKITNRKVLYSIFLVLALIPLFSPLGIPVGVSFTTTDLINTVEAVPEGSTIAIGFQGEVMPQRRTFRVNAFWDYLCRRNYKMIVYCYKPTSPVVWDRSFIDFVEAPRKYGYEYGTDWIVFPFLGGDESAMAALAANLRYFDKDYYGTPIEDLPIMEGMYTLDDVALVTYTGEYSFSTAITRQWPGKYNVKAVYPGGFDVIAQYYNVYVFGCIDGQRGLTEFESQVGYDGEALMKAEMRSLIVGAAFIIIIAINIGEFINPSERVEAVDQVKRGVI